MIDKVVDALVKKDSEALSACFSENCSYIDYCPSLHGGQNVYAYGNTGVQMASLRKFLAGELEVAEPEIENENFATFFVSYNGPYIYAGLRIDEYDNGGLIKRAVVHPV
jgi:hypothetical protein